MTTSFRRSAVYDFHLMQSLDHAIGAVLEQVFRRPAAADTDDASKAARMTGCDARQGVLEHNSASRLDAQAPSNFQKQGRVWLACQAQLLYVHSVDPLINQIIEPCSAENFGAVLAR